MPWPHSRPGRARPQQAGDRPRLLLPPLRRQRGTRTAHSDDCRTQANLSLTVELVPESVNLRTPHFPGHTGAMQDQQSHRRHRSAIGREEAEPVNRGGMLPLASWGAVLTGSLSALLSLSMRPGPGIFCTHTDDMTNIDNGWMRWSMVGPTSVSPRRRAPKPRHTKACSTNSSECCRRRTSPMRRRRTKNTLMHRPGGR